MCSERNQSRVSLRLNRSPKPVCRNSLDFPIRRCLVTPLDNNADSRIMKPPIAPFAAMLTIMLALLAPGLQEVRGQTLGEESEGSSRLWEMRNKVNRLRDNRARSFLTEVESALNAGNPDKAERALAAAIGQGKLTQDQIDRNRAGITAARKEIEAAALAQARAREEAEKPARMATATGGGKASGSGSAPAAKGPKWVQVKVELDRNAFDDYTHLRAAAISNAERGRKAAYRSGTSPGNCAGASKSTTVNGAETSFTFTISNVGNGVAGEYYFEATAIYVEEKKVLGEGEASRSTTVGGTFKIPAGWKNAVIHIDGNDPKQIRVTEY